MKNWKKGIRAFLFPEMKRVFWIRLIGLAVLSFLFFKFVCLPMRLNGASMEPSYHDGSFRFCWVPVYWFRGPARGDVVSIRYGGDSVMLLKRIIGMPGETIEIRSGHVYLDGRKLEEPYVKFRSSDWNLSPRKISPGSVYVIGDNRGMPADLHKFGEVPMKRLKGILLF